MPRDSGKAAYVIGVDLGTSSLKALLLRQDGWVAGAITRSYPLVMPQPGWAEQDPQEWWIIACAAIRALLDDTGVTPAAVRAIAVGGQMHGTVLLDDRGMPLRPAIIWPDGRTARESAQAEEALRARRLLARLGGGVSPGFMLASLLWCRRHEPERWRRVRTVLLPKDYLRFRLTGSLATEPSDGSGIPLIDLESVGGPDPTGANAGWDWCFPALEALDLSPALLPPLLASAAPAGLITPAAALATGLIEGTPVLCGGSDQAMAAIGAGLLAPGTLLISISTGGQLVTPLARPLARPEHGLRTLCHAIPGVYLALAATLGAGLSLRWLRETVLDDQAPGGEARLMDLAATAPAGAGGLLFLPYLAGERTPLLDPDASGALVGLRLDHDRAHLARAVLEGVAFSLRQALEPLRAAGVRTDRILLAGGVARHPLMRAIVAAVLGQPLIPLATGEQSALGAALLAATHLGHFAELQAACDATVALEPAVVPDPLMVDRYADRYTRYLGLYPSLRADMHALRQGE